ncbi:hypothetical protein CTAYLR_002664 [Chrysophaeum taylorii]|uniref:Uncharacterized protein n=1 Tax=Chrysophaeum taylorii TaxID=2483200 RepID=A0AAD7UBR5_9STRA|nr:hypothetical protein CTAYLR_002664 [Chrysophaeum taylorii]
MCSAQSVSYANTNPLMLLSGCGAVMRDEKGRAYLDTRNNVAHVGHAHPAVARAVATQVHTLNTNTRYLHPNVCALARKLVETMPAGSELRETGVVFFVNSGSEANDLALRLCAAYTKRRGVVVVDGAYHGHTKSVAGISPYKYAYLGGKPDAVEAVPTPDVYRGSASAESARRDTAAAARKLREDGRGVSAFFVESGMSVAGVVMAPEGWMRAAFETVRGAGGLCVADEVQTAMGRTGRWWYAFEAHGVFPDLVTLGKPLGNGMPLAAVVVVGRCADEFAKGPEYFNTFGGNPVCCAAGLSVFDVLKAERLRNNATAVGNHLVRRLRAIGEDASLDRVTVGDVRGIGLFLGADLVTDRTTKTPATRYASLLCSALVQRHNILTSLDGPGDNVIVIKPPMCFSIRDADRFLDALHTELRRLNVLPPPILGKNNNVATRTPT